MFEDSGREAMIGKRILLGVGIPEDMIIIEDSSLNTKQNAENVKNILETKGFSSPILVTSAFYMERSVLNFSRIGVEVIPFPADYMANKKSGVYFITLFLLQMA